MLRRNREERTVSEDLCNLGLLEVSGRIRRRELSAEAVTRATLSRIERHEPALNSIMMLLADDALDAARRADAEIAAGFWRGPLHGVPIGIKDLLWTKGLPTTGGMEILKDFRPTQDATVVARLKRAGAVLIAKLHMTEGAGYDHHPVFPRPSNPWSATHWTGVSSSGSGVAVAAGFCFGAIGSDTGGSIRMPCSANNLTGIKPTWGRVSRHGVIALVESFDHIGPMARSAADAAAMLQAIAGADPRDPTALSEPVPDYLSSLHGGVSDLVVGVDWTYATEGVDAPVAAAVHDAADVLSDLGAQVREVRFPWDPDQAAGSMAVFAAELAVAHADHFPQKADRYGPRLREMVQGADAFDAVAVARGYQARDRLAGPVRAIFREVDLLLTPGLGVVLPTWDEAIALGDDMAAMSRTVLRFTAPFNVTGLPTISLPGGFTDEGLPIGVQLIGPALAEPVLIRAGAAFQSVTGFHTRRPPLD
jgi:amidase